MAEDKEEITEEAVEKLTGDLEELEEDGDMKGMINKLAGFASEMTEQNQD